MEELDSDIGVVVNALEDFPSSCLLPKKETGVCNLLNKHPSYNGEGVIIVIFDSGVDPGADGLRVTPDGKPKIIDRIDASGAGDVDTSVVVEAEDGFITGLTGRKLRVSETWVNPSGKYHIGVKNIFSLYPEKLKTRLAKEYKEKHWDRFQKPLLAECQRKLQSLDKDKNGADKDSMGYLEKLAKEDAEFQLSHLKYLDEHYTDNGPTYDCIVFNDGELWRACIDTTECGELSEAVTLSEYYQTHEWATLTHSDQFNVSVNIYNEGNLLEIVGMCLSHGTHVAAIASAYFPEEPHKDGIAPGAQIVSVTIGDSRLNGMETVTALVRAMIHVMENPNYKVDLINMSYGEFSHWSNSGRFGEIANEVINKYGIIWVVSAGNHGPALSTIGAPPDMQSDVMIGTGAYVSPDMMIADYAMLEKLPGNTYTWSSRGPTIDGCRGVCICAPGCAITSVPKYDLKRSLLMNGTSMAAPHTSGCVALLLSALKQNNMQYSPYLIRRALQNTAKPLGKDVFSQGHGLLQVEEALAYLLKNGIEDTDKIIDKVHFHIECGSEKTKGIYMRNWLADKPIDINVTVEPKILDDAHADPVDKLKFEVEFVFTCDVPWIKFPACLHMSYASRSFYISLDPRGLKRSCVYFASVKAFISKKPNKGPIFEVPITVISPIIDIPYGSVYSSARQVYKRGTINSAFIYVPTEATWANITFMAFNAEKCLKFIFHAVQLKPLSSVRTLEFYKLINLANNETESYAFAVRGGLTLQLCIARWWSCLVDGELEYTIRFHSLKPINEEALLPSENKIEALTGIRDTLPGNKPIYQIVLCYNFSLSKVSEVIPKCSLLNDVLYESPYESQLWMLYDSNKQVIAIGDAYCDKYSVKLKKGDYVIRLHVRHEVVSFLEDLTELPLTVYIKLPHEIKLNVYSSYIAAAQDGKKTASVTLTKEKIQPIFVTAPNLHEKSIKALGISLGHFLIGTLSLTKDEQAKKASNNHKFGPIAVMPGQYVIKVVITEAAAKKKSAVSDEKKEVKSYSEYQDALKELQTSWISKLDSEHSEILYQDIIVSFPDWSPAILARMLQFDASNVENREIIAQFMDSINKSIDIEQLLAYYGMKTDPRPDAAKIKSQMDKKRSVLVEALAHYGSSICCDLLQKSAEECPQEDLAIIEETCQNILKFFDSTGSKVNGLFSYYYHLHGFDGLALRIAFKNHEESTKETELKLIEAYRNLGWNHVVKFHERLLPAAFPLHYLPF